MGRLPFARDRLTRQAAVSLPLHDTLQGIPFCMLECVCGLQKDSELASLPVARSKFGPVPKAWPIMISGDPPRGLGIPG